MRIAGIVSEYNPFHNGHALHIRRTVGCGASHIVSVMSGSFVQRGESAVLSKFARANAAVEGGADLVLELPLPWCISTAQRFAMGGVGILSSLGCVNMLSFGSESGDIGLISDTSRAICSPEFSSVLKTQLDTGLSFAVARESTMRIMGLNTEALVSPNDTLAVEYLCALSKLDSEIEPLAIKREGAGHDSNEVYGSIAGASKIRELMLYGMDVSLFLPDSSYDIIVSETESGRAPVRYSALESAIICALRQKTAAEIKNAPDISEGIENRIYSSAREAVSLQQLFDAAKAKRYSHARIRRIVLNSFLRVVADDSEGLPPYARVLALNEKGCEILKTAKKTSKIPIVMKPSEIPGLGSRAERIFRLECAATDVFAMAMPNPQKCGEDFYHKITVL